MSVPSTSRTRADSCPGALHTHPAADGALARVRLPGGLLTVPQLRGLATAARDLGDGALELTSRGNVQLRGLAPGAEVELAARLAAAGLLPSATHERVRNVLASALSGRAAGGHVDVRPWVSAFDKGLCADPALAGLPGRFLATLDDGRGDVAGEEPDVCWRAPGSLLVAGADTGLRVDAGVAVAALLDAAEAFLGLRAADGGAAWRAAELADGPARIAAALVEHGRPPGTPVAVITDGSTPTQRVVRTTLAELGRTVAEEGVRPPAVWVAGDVVALSAGSRAVHAVAAGAPPEPDDED